jgi:phosphate starvation-inducible membrane PsiE
MQIVIFGIMTIYNTKQVHVIPTAVSRHRRTENQLVGMLLLQVGTYIVLIILTSVTYLMLVFPNPIQTTSAFYFARITYQLFLYFSFATPFLLYLISARIYRKELVLVLYKILRLRGANEISPTTNTIINTIMPINTTGHRLSSKR